jgi:hypothetical protein
MQLSLKCEMETRPVIDNAAGFSTQRSCVKCFLHDFFDWRKCTTERLSTTVTGASSHQTGVVSVSSLIRKCTIETIINLTNVNFNAK